MVAGTWFGGKVGLFGTTGNLPENRMTAVGICPRCGAPMQPGSLGMMSFVGGAAWYTERTALALHGESVVGKPLGGMVWLDGTRCLACRLLVLAY